MAARTLSMKCTDPGEVWFDGAIYEIEDANGGSVAIVYEEDDAKAFINAASDPAVPFLTPEQREAVAKWIETKARDDDDCPMEGYAAGCWLADEFRKDSTL